MPTPASALRRQNILRQVIYVLVAVAVTVPYLVHVSLPIRPTAQARRLYEQVNALKPGSHVLLSMDYDPSSQAELNPMTTALLLNCFRNGVVPIVMTHWPSGVGLARSLLEEAAARAETLWGKKEASGETYVFLGFRPGGANLVLNMGVNLRAAFPTDYYGKATQGMKALQGVHSLQNINLVIDLAAGATVEMWIAYGSDRFGFPLGVGTTAVQAPDLYPWLQSNQIVGFLGGLRGAADYEALVGLPGQAIEGMPSQSAAHVLLVVLVLLANAGYLVGRLRRR